MSNLMEYKGYHASIVYSDEDNIFVGKVCWITDNLTFEGESITEITDAFHDTIDEYLEFCVENGKEPCKEFRGTFNVRISPILHKSATLCAAKQNITLNEFVSHAIATAVAGDSEQRIAEQIVLKLSSQPISNRTEMLYRTNNTVLTSQNLGRTINIH